MHKLWEFIYSKVNVRKGKRQILHYLKKIHGNVYPFGFFWCYRWEDLYNLTHAWSRIRIQQQALLCQVSHYLQLFFWEIPFQAWVRQLWNYSPAILEKRGSLQKQKKRIINCIWVILLCRHNFLLSILLETFFYVSITSMMIHLLKKSSLV